MPNALIYSSSLHGHRQMHVFVFAHLLSELGYKLFVAGDFNTAITNSNSYYINKLKEDRNIIRKDTRIYAQNGFKIGNAEFIELQKECNADLTIFVEADNHIRLFTSQIFNKKKKLRGKTIGLFLRPFYFYQKLNFLNRFTYIRHLLSTWRSDEFLFHEYLLKRFQLLNSALYIDENFVSEHTYSHLLPDVFQSYAEILVKDENPEQRIWIERLDRFKQGNRGKFIFFYFGTAQKRRGYDLLLKMAVEYNACFVHCGLKEEGVEEKYDFDITELRNILLSKGRLMETSEYITDPLCIEYFFKSVDHLVLPYRDFWGSSGVMLQALSYGIPVLVPDKGIMGYLVKKYKLGFTYNEITSLPEKFKQFERSSSEAFRDSIAGYMKYQTPEELKRILVNIFKGLCQTIEGSNI